MIKDVGIDVVKKVKGTRIIRVNTVWLQIVNSFNYEREIGNWIGIADLM